jgi:hypothetical protein
VLGSFALATFTIRLAMPQLSRRFTEWQGADLYAVLRHVRVWIVSAVLVASSR